jgi:WD40 repeat protein
VLVLDLHSPVNDISWSPYSSTILGTVTSDGNIYIYDFNVSKYLPICQQNILQKRKKNLTHILFNAKRPVLMVSDER